MTQALMNTNASVLGWQWLADDPFMLLVNHLRLYIP